MPQTSFTIKYNNYPTLWKIKSQSENNLSTTEANHTDLSYYAREVVPFLPLREEINDTLCLGNDFIEAITSCKVFEDNNGATQIAKCPTLRPYTKHIAIKFHHFRSNFLMGLILSMPSTPKSIYLSKLFVI